MGERAGWSTLHIPRFAALVCEKIHPSPDKEDTSVAKSLEQRIQEMEDREAIRAR